MARFRISAYPSYSLFKKIKFYKIKTLRTRHLPRCLQVVENKGKVTIDTALLLTVLCSTRLDEFLVFFLSAEVSLKLKERRGSWKRK